MKLPLFARVINGSISRCYFHNMKHDASSFDGCLRGRKCYMRGLLVNLSLSDAVALQKHFHGDDTPRECYRRSYSDGNNIPHYSSAVNKIRGVAAGANFVHGASHIDPLWRLRTMRYVRGAPSQ